MSIYKLQITTAEGLKGTVYNIKSGCMYKIDKTFNLIDLAGHTVESTSSSFDALFEWKNAFTHFYEKNDNSMSKFCEANNILLVNKANDNLNVKVSADTANSFEDYIELEPLVFATYRRKAGKYIASISKKGEDACDQYELTTRECYVWDNSSGLVNLTRNCAKVEKYIKKDSKFNGTSNNKNYKKY